MVQVDSLSIDRWASQRNQTVYRYFEVWRKSHRRSNSHYRSVDIAQIWHPQHLPWRSYSTFPGIPFAFGFTARIFMWVQMKSTRKGFDDEFGLFHSLAHSTDIHPFSLSVYLCKSRYFYLAINIGSLVGQIGMSFSESECRNWDWEIWGRRGKDLFWHSLPPSNDRIRRILAGFLASNYRFLIEPNRSLDREKQIRQITSFRFSTWSIYASSQVCIKRKIQLEPNQDCQKFEESRLLGISQAISGRSSGSPILDVIFRR